MLRLVPVRVMSMSLCEWAGCGCKFRIEAAAMWTKTQDCTPAIAFHSRHSFLLLASLGQPLLLVC